MNRRIYQYDKVTGELLNFYCNKNEAARVQKVNPIELEKACNGELKNSGGYCWSYGLALNYQQRPDLRKKQVFQFTKEGDFLGNFISVAEAARKTKINKTSIAKCCRGEYKTAGGYNWVYESKSNFYEKRNSL